SYVRQAPVHLRGPLGASVDLLADARGYRPCGLGPGLTNAMTGIAEAAKSRTPLVVLAGETPAAALTSNFRIDQHDLVESAGAIADRVHSPKTAADDAQRAYQRAQTERRPVVLMLPIDIQPQPAAGTEPTQPPLPPLPA